MDQELRPGARLGIKDLAATLGVSATPVREALVRLAVERLVEVEPFRGYSVSLLPSAERLDELMRVRALIEVGAAKDALARVTQPQLRAIEREFEAMSELTPRPAYRLFARFHQHDRVFHEMIVALAGNRVLLECYRALSVHLQLHRLYRIRGAVDHREALPEHAAIVAALRSGQSIRLERALATHISGAAKRLGAVLEKQTSQRVEERTWATSRS